MGGKYSIGLDFGTLSVRALVAEIGTGRELATAVSEYPHGVMDRELPCGVRLPPDWALQHPDDYIDCMARVVREAVAASKVPTPDIVGIGVDFTACTVIAVDSAGVPLCKKPELERNPHSWVKLWKHHAAQDEAAKLNEIASARGEDFLARYGGKISSEWMFPKIWQVLDEAPEIYEATDRFMEAGDWLIMMLTGQEARSSCMAGYKAMWHKRKGYPSGDFFAALNPRLREVVDDKLSRDILPIGARAGGLTGGMAELLGLSPGTSVATCNVDAHVSLPPTGITESGKMLMIMGTSTCHIILSDEERAVPGMCGVVEDGVIPGLLGYEAGQSCVGDHFNWFVENLLPAEYSREAVDKGLSPHQLLTEKAARLAPGQSGLVALDWWNGNRSVLVDVDLTGLIVGMTLATTAEEIYRALIEATAYGTRMIIETFEASGVKIGEVYACGGIAKKNPLLMQIYSDVTGREIRVAASDQAPALGSAMFGAVAAGAARGGYDSITEAARDMGGVMPGAYRPDSSARAMYDRLYAEYVRLHDMFGRGGCDVMKRLKRIRLDAN